MNPKELSQVQGQVFVHPETGREFGTIRPCQVADHPVATLDLALIAEDDCGNAFAVDTAGKVVFWDHETDELTTLAPSRREFVAACRPPAEVGEVDTQSVWIDPEFAKKMGIVAPEDGWIKKSKP